MIQVKNPSVLRELLVERYHPILVELMLWIEHRYNKIVLTSGYREDDPGVHGTIPCRGMDIRSWGLLKKDNSRIDPISLCNDVNEHWQYDPDRPEMVCCKRHNTGQGWHIHNQVSKNTTMR